MASNPASRGFMVRFKSGLRLLSFALAAAASLSACGAGGAETGGINPAMSGQIFIESHPGSAAEFSTPSGVTVEHWMNSARVETTKTDEYGRFRFQAAMTMMMSYCTIRISDDALSIDASHSLDMTGKNEVSVYGMVYDSAGQNYAWVHEFSRRWNDMPDNFDGTMDADDMQNFWEEGSHSWGSFGGRTMYTM